MRTCERCGRRIRGPSCSVAGKHWHPRHFTCCVCGTRLENAAVYLHAGELYCRADYYRRVLPACAVCGVPLVGTHRVDLWGNRYCTRHEAEYPRCSACGRVICSRLTRGGTRYPDGRHVCNVCTRTAVFAEAEGERVFGEVRAYLVRAGLDLGIIHIPFRFVDAQWLTRLLGPGAPRCAGIIVTRGVERTGRFVREHTEVIAILGGLPREYLALVIAHELGHYYLNKHRFPRLPLWVEEGIAELFAYLWLSHQRTAAAAARIRAMERSPDPVYGTGFRGARESFRARSLPGMLAHVRRTRGFF